MVKKKRKKERKKNLTQKKGDDWDRLPPNPQTAPSDMERAFVPSVATEKRQNSQKNILPKTSLDVYNSTAIYLFGNNCSSLLNKLTLGMHCIDKDNEILGWEEK